MSASIEPLHATLLGLIEGLTEFLPISSTGHLILAAEWLGLRGEAVKTFEIVIQAGALGAVCGLYWQRIVSMWRGLWGVDAAGRRLLVNLLVSFMPATVLGLMLHQTIKERLFAPWAIACALAAGGVLMIGIDRWVGRVPRRQGVTVEHITWTEALWIGVAQCLSLWPGASRSMVTIVGGMILGFPATVAAEYSFLLALPTLGAATLFDTMAGGGLLLEHAGALSLICGFLAAAIVAALTIRGLIRYLTRRGLAMFGWYRLGLAALVWMAIWRP